MADYVVAVSKHATLTGTTVDSVTVTQSHAEVEILNRGSGEIFAVVSEQVDDVETVVDPGDAGDNTIVVPAGFAVTVESPGNRGSTVKIVGDGDAYSVQAVTG